MRIGRGQGTEKEELRNKEREGEGEAEDSLSGLTPALPVTCTSRVFAYPRHDQDPICIAPMKLLPSPAARDPAFFLPEGYVSV